MTDHIYATPTTQSSIAPATDTNTSVTTNYQPTGNKPLSGGRDPRDTENGTRLASFDEPVIPKTGPTPT